MALDDILEAIRLETDAEIEAIEADAAARAAAIADEGARAAAVAEAELAGVRDLDAVTAGNRIRNGARLEGDRELRAAREAIVQRIFTEVKGRLDGLRNSADYPAILGRLAREASSVLPEANVVQVDARDAALVDGLFDDSVEVVADLSIRGGLVLASADGRTVHNTVEVRVERAAPHMRRLIAELIPELGAHPS